MRVADEAQALRQMFEQYQEFFQKLSKSVFLDVNDL